MAEVVGALLPTQIPSLSEAANIQEAFRLYHYGRPTGTGAGQYDPTNTNPSELNPTGNTPSIAFYLQNLQNQITSISGTLGVQATTWSTKGAIVTATAPSTVAALSVGTNGQVLTANSATATGLQWSAPEVTLSNAATLTNKNISLATNSITGTLAQFNTALTDANFLTDSVTATLTNKTINLSSNTISGTLAQFNTALSDGTFVTTDATQTLTNKTIAGSQITGNISGNASNVTGTVAVANGGTGATAATAAKSNLEIFRNATNTFGGTIHVRQTQPTSAAAGDIWLW
jgi:hypothetical protein